MQVRDLNMWGLAFAVIVSSLLFGYGVWLARPPSKADLLAVTLVSSLIGSVVYLMHADYEPAT